VIIVRKMVNLTGVHPKILALIGVRFDQMAQVDP
jgi:hypothetical protein